MDAQVSGQWAAQLRSRRRQHGGSRGARLANVLRTWALCALALGLMIGLPGIARAASPRQRPGSCGATQLSASPAVAATHTDGARIALNIARGGAGSKLIAQGMGWPAGAQLTLSLEQYGTVIPNNHDVPLTVAADGTFAAPPLAAPGPTCGFDPQPGTAIQIVGRMATNSQLMASATFTYIASPPALAPAVRDGAIAPDATSLPVTGVGWDAGTLVTLWPTPEWPASAPLDPWQPPAGVPSIQLAADAQGAFTAQVPLLAGTSPRRPGVTMLAAASATSARYGTLVTSVPQPFEVQPLVAPVLALDRTGGVAGVTIGVTGDQWWPGDVVQIAYCRGAVALCNVYATQALGTATVNRAGHFSAQVALPANARTGPITVEAYAGSGLLGPYVVARHFQVVAGGAPANPPHAQPPGAAPLLVTVLLGLLMLAGVLDAVWLLARRRRLA
jgi:hypothetical protein